MSPTRRKIERNEIEVARQRLLEAIYSELPDDRFAGREAVKQLLGTLMAARDRGLPFERIAGILQQSGVELSPVTLRRYFFELKTEDGLAADSLRHRRKVAQTRDAIQRQMLERHTEHANELAAQQTQAAPQPVSTWGGREAYPDANNSTQEPDESARVRRHLAARPARPASPASPPAAPEAMRLDSGRLETASADAKSAVNGIPPAEKPAGVPFTIDAGSGPLTLTAIEAASRATEERTDLLEDVELREAELVFYVSGQPFQGFLSQRQIRLLRTVGKIIAPTRGRSSKDFVTMPARL